MHCRALVTYILLFKFSFDRCWLVCKSGLTSVLLLHRTLAVMTESYCVWTELVRYINSNGSTDLQVRRSNAEALTAFEKSPSGVQMFFSEWSWIEQVEELGQYELAESALVNLQLDAITLYVR